MILERFFPNHRVSQEFIIALVATVFIPVSIILALNFLPYSDGVTTEATIVSAEFSHTNPGNNHFFRHDITFDLPNGEPYVAELVQRGERTVGDTMTISYRESNPADFREPSTAFLALSGLIFLLGAGAAVAAYKERPTRREPEPATTL